jgi:hypothetical protein
MFVLWYAIWWKESVSMERGVDENNAAFPNPYPVKSLVHVLHASLMHKTFAKSCIG